MSAARGTHPLGMAAYDPHYDNEELGFRRGVNGHRKEMMVPESRRDETTILPPTH